MAKFRKKPVVIDAIQLSGPATVGELFDFLDGATWATTANNGIDIVTLEGTMHASENDWIIRGVKGGFYPCKPDIFEATYDAV